MKKILFSLMAAATLLSASSGSFKTIDMMVENIKKPRKGLDISVLMKVEDPFVVATMNTEMSEVVVSELKKPVPNFSLIAIINHEAYLNDAWRKEGEKIQGYELKFVGNRGVVLTFEKRIVKLMLPEKNTKVEGLIMMKEGK